MDDGEVWIKKLFNTHTHTQRYGEDTACKKKRVREIERKTE